MEDHAAFQQVQISRVANDNKSRIADFVVQEEPLEMSVVYGAKDKREQFTLAITMRTPGQDEDLMRGFLLTERIVESGGDIINCSPSNPNVAYNKSITAELSPEVVFLRDKQQRNFFTTSSCGVCGKTSLDMVRQVSAYRTIQYQPTIKASSLHSMSTAMRSAQSVFHKTGGIHAAALFDPDGNMIALCEDIGRHNAVDKLIGQVTRTSNLPLNNHILMVSGRAGFELVQKAAVTGIPLFVAVGAPSGLSIELALETGMTLIGFLKETGFNIYTHPERITSE